MTTTKISPTMWFVWAVHLLLLLFVWHLQGLNSEQPTDFPVSVIPTEQPQPILVDSALPDTVAAIGFIDIEYPVGDSFCRKRHYFNSHNKELAEHGSDFHEEKNIK